MLNLQYHMQPATFWSNAQILNNATLSQGCYIFCYFKGHFRGTIIFIVHHYMRPYKLYTSDHQNLQYH